MIDFVRLESREVPLVPRRAALLIVDVQNFSAHPEGGELKGLDAAELEARHGWYFRQLRSVVVPNLQRLQAACRRAGVEVLYTVIESLTRDGRDRRLDYKITGFHVPRGSWDAQVLDACDLGYLVTLVTDACTTGSAERHTHALAAIRGYCRQVTTEALSAELAPDRT
jgi:ureidoacrylate peracid hydrolase